MLNGLVIASNFPRFKGDSYGWFIHEISKRFAESGYEIYVLAPHEYGIKFYEKFDNINISRFPYFFPLKMQRLAYRSGIPYNIKGCILAKLQLPFFFIAELGLSFYLIKIKKIDFVHAHWFFPQGLVAAICKKILKVPTIITIHSSEITRLKKLPFGEKIGKFIFNHVDLIVSVSSHRAKELLEFIEPNNHNNMFINKKIKIIPMGVSAEKLVSNLSKEQIKSDLGVDSKYVLLFLGRLVEVKGVQHLIESLKHIVEKVRDIELIIVGSGELEDDLKRLAESKGLENYIRFEGFVEHEFIANYYSIADIFVFPSIVDSNGFQEGLPVTLIEALAAGKPVVASNILGVREIIVENKNGILIDPMNHIEMANSILKLLEDQPFREFLSRNAAKSVEVYNWNNIVYNYIKELNQILYN